MKAQILWMTLLATPVAAQFENPGEKIREIAEEVAKEMQEIDRLLLQTGAGKGAIADKMANSAKKMEELLKLSTGSQGNVVRKIDDLIAELEKMRGKGKKKKGQRQSRNQKQQQSQGKKKGNKKRRQNNVPDRRQKSQQGKKKGGKDSKGNERDTAKGRNRNAKKRPEDPTEKLEHGKDNERWGELPAYEELLKNRGGRPEVPEKYRRFYEAFLKRHRKSDAGKRR